jgi:hypothetical protein
MGHTTDFIGHVDINPPLNSAEQAYLTAFSASRRCDRSGGPYEVPGNPVAELEQESTMRIDRYNRTAPEQPSLWCDWEPCWDGCCLSFDGIEKFYGATRWLEYLIEHFLRPGAYASASGLPQFEDFTFDHRADGIVAGCQRKDKKLFLIRVEDSVVTETILRPADPRYGDFPPLPYEAAEDRAIGRGTVRRRRQRPRLSRSGR